MRHKVIIHGLASDAGNIPVLHQELRDLNEQHRKWLLITGRFPNRDTRRRMERVSALSPQHNNRAITAGRKQFRVAKLFNGLLPIRAIEHLKSIGSGIKKIFRRKTL